MLSCKELAKKTLSEEPLTFKEKVERWIHLKMCAACRVFMRQIDNLNKSLGKSLKTKDYENEKQQLKEEIFKALDEKNNS